MANYLVGTDWQTFVPGTAALVDPARGPASPVVKGTLALKDWLKNPKDIKGAAARAVLDTIYTVGGPVGAVLGEINKFQRAHNQRAWSKDELESAIKRLLNQVGD
jgi:hypothetical protein